MQIGCANAKTLGTQQGNPIRKRKLDLDITEKEKEKMQQLSTALKDAT